MEPLILDVVKGRLAHRLVEDAARNIVVKIAKEVFDGIKGRSL
jgi:hypothetical protein